MNEARLNSVAYPVALHLAHTLAEVRYASHQMSATAASPCNDVVMEDCSIVRVQQLQMLYHRRCCMSVSHAITGEDFQFSCFINSKHFAIVPGRRLPSCRRCSWATTTFHSEPNMCCDVDIQHLWRQNIRSCWTRTMEQSSIALERGGLIAQ